MIADGEKLLNLLRRINNFSQDKTPCRPFTCQGCQVGIISDDVLSTLQNYPDVFLVTDSEVTFTNDHKGFIECSQALREVVVDLSCQPELESLREGWRDESYVISRVYGSAPLFSVERAAAPLLGLRKHGVQINGYVNHPDKGVMLWFQRRSRSKPTYPGQIDNFVGGAITEGRGALETAVKEGEEEAGLNSALTQRLSACGSISYLHQSSRGIHPLTEFVFDLELPINFSPTNKDGEVDEWILCPISKIFNILFSEDLKITSAPVIIDFLVRHSFINMENQPDLPRIIEMLHTPIHNR